MKKAMKGSSPTCKFDKRVDSIKRLKSSRALGQLTRVIHITRLKTTFGEYFLSHLSPTFRKQLRLFAAEEKKRKRFMGSSKRKKPFKQMADSLGKSLYSSTRCVASILCAQWDTLNRTYREFIESGSKAYVLGSSCDSSRMLALCSSYAVKHSRLFSSVSAVERR